MTRRRGILLGAAIVAVGVVVVVGVGIASLQANDNPKLDPRDATSILGIYLDAVERGDYDVAAQLLAVGDEALAERSDLRPLAVDDLSVTALAAGLADYCSNGCLATTSMTVDEADDEAYVIVASFGEPRGHPLERSFTVGERDDGARYVRGLPPAGTGTIPRPG